MPWGLFRSTAQPATASLEPLPAPHTPDSIDVRPTRLPGNQPRDLIAETDENGTLIREYLYLGEQAIAMRISGNRLYYVHNDHLGTPRILTDQTLAKMWEVQATPFGEVSEEITTGITNLKGLPGPYRDEETDYADNWNRTYNPSIGRYVQSDPIGLGGGLNTYGYVNGNPINFYDPNGLIACAATGNWSAACAAVAAGAEAAATAAVFVGGMLIPSGVNDGTLYGNETIPPYFNDSDDEAVPYFPELSNVLDPDDFVCEEIKDPGTLPDNWDINRRDPSNGCSVYAASVATNCLAKGGNRVMCMAKGVTAYAACMILTGEGSGFGHH